jgi:hypothetical protein
MKKNLPFLLQFESKCIVQFLIVISLQYLFVLMSVWFCEIFGSEFYFSDRNLSVDKYLRSQMDLEGFVDLATIMKFRRMIALQVNVEQVGGNWLFLWCCQSLLC